MEKLLNGETPAAALFNGPSYMAEQMGFSKIMDTTFMISATVAPDADREDLRKYYAALKRAQAEIDARPEQYTHYYKNEFPVRFHAQMDTRRWGPGERIVQITRIALQRSGTSISSSFSIASAKPTFAASGER